MVKSEKAQSEPSDLPSAPHMYLDAFPGTATMPSVSTADIPSVPYSAYPPTTIAPHDLFSAQISQQQQSRIDSPDTVVPSISIAPTASPAEVVARLSEPVAFRMLQNSICVLAAHQGFEGILCCHVVFFMKFSFGY